MRLMTNFTFMPTKLYYVGLHLLLLQLAFDAVQQHFYDLKPVLLNADKNKSNDVFKCKIQSTNLPSVFTSRGTKTECVPNYTYFGILIDGSLSFTPHI